jgi:two-component system sensor histidine kinase UhpB
VSTIGAHRILREALVNTGKHAQARHVELELTENGTALIARLTADRVGAASLDAGPGHLGMATMWARAAAEGATLNITSTPGTGTTVMLALPAAAVDAGRR